MTRAAKTEFPAAARFSARINSGDAIAGLPDMDAIIAGGSEKPQGIRRESVARCEIPRTTGKSR